MTRKHLLATLIFACLVGGSAYGVSPVDNAQANAGTATRGQVGRRVAEYSRRLAGFGYSGVLLVAKNGKIILREAYGSADKERDIPNTVDTVFDIASLSKQFTAAAVLRLEMEGKLKVGDPLSRHLSNVPADKAGITIHQLLSHTSGLPGGGVGRAQIGRDQMVELILGQPLSDAPGARFRYSNAGYILLAAVVEVTSGERFQEYVKRKIFRPAGMTRTGFWGEVPPGANASHIARGHDDFNRGGNPLEWSGTSWRNLGQSGIMSSVGDLYRWHLALEGEAILSREAKAKMWTPVLDGYGYGWWVKKTGRRTTEISHGGDGDGFGSYFGWFRDDRVLIISLSNVRHDLYPTHVKADEVIPGIIFGQPYDTPPAFIRGSLRLKSRLVGTYRLNSGGELVVRIERGELHIGAAGQDAVDVLREGDQKELAERASLTSKTRGILEAYLRGDMSPLVEVGADDPDFQKSIGDEIKEIGDGKGRFQSFDVLGTAPAGEPGVHNTFLRLNYERGSGPYRFRWRGNRLDGTYIKSSALATLTPLQPESATAFVGWNIMSWDETKGFKLYPALEKGEVTGIRVRRGESEWVARKL
jgi:CubicO group peptidase (beta-lactamase class C family)